MRGHLLGVDTEIVHRRSIILCVVVQPRLGSFLGLGLFGRADSLALLDHDLDVSRLRELVSLSLLLLSLPMQRVDALLAITLVPFLVSQSGLLLFHLEVS